MINQKKLVYLLKGLVFSYVVTGVILSVLAVGVWKFDFGVTSVNIGMIAAYILSALIGGLYVGKKMKEKKFIWGILVGGAYILVLLGASLVSNGPVGLLHRNTVTTALICVLSGMLGGMLG